MHGILAWKESLQARQDRRGSFCRMLCLFHGQREDEDYSCLELEGHGHGGFYEEEGEEGEEGESFGSGFSDLVQSFVC